MNSMVQLAIFVGSVISFVVGCIIFLIGIGAIAGCTLGIIFILSGGLLSLLGAFATISFFIPHSKFSDLNVNDAINLIKKNGQWIVEEAFS